MKFDKIIMNPPYMRSTHLKILNEEMQHLEETGELINLSPTRWLMDPLAKFKKTSDLKRYANIINHLESVEEFDAIKATIIFKASLSMTIGIYKILGRETEFDRDTLLDKISLKIYNKLKEVPILEKNKQEGWRVRIPIICSGDAHGGGPSRKYKLRGMNKFLYFYNGMKDGRPWHEFYQKNQWSKTTPYITYSIKFKNEEEAKHCCDIYYNSNIFKYYCHFFCLGANISIKSFIWLGGCVNPRTGLIGYESDWTDEDMCKYFDISDDEYSEIKKFVESFK